MTVLAGAALCASTVDVIGWWWWRSTTATLAVQPSAGVARLAGSRLMELPRAVQRSRWLVSRDLIGADQAAVATALDRLGSLQRRWFHADSSGFKNTARAALLDNRPAQALQELELATTRDPTSARLHRLMALVLFEAGRRDGCLDHLAESESIAPGLASPAVEVLRDEARWIRLEGLRRRLTRYPRQRVATVLTMAEELKRGGEHARGRSMLENELPHPEAELALARWDMAETRYDEAAGRVQRVTSRRGYPARLRARAWSLLAEVRDLTGDAQGANDAADEALALDPESAAPYVALARLAERRGDNRRAVDCMRTAWGLAPTDVRVLGQFARVAEKAGETSDARLALERAVKVEPESPEHAARLVDFLIRNGEFLDALTQLSRFLDRFPTNERLLRLADRLNREVTRPRGR
jgi:Tfp pilus assembly protein PilF